MPGSLEEFAAQVRSDPELAHKVFFAEASAANAIWTLRDIAKAEGLDISPDPPSSSASSPTPTQTDLQSSCGVVADTCCYVFTSTFVTEPQ
jgi:hypothetical protein